jgi:hypothetical protein
MKIPSRKRILRVANEGSGWVALRHHRNTGKTRYASKPPGYAAALVVAGTRIRTFPPSPRSTGGVRTT